MRSRHKLLALALSLALLLSLAVPVCAAETTTSTTKDLTGHIVILHTNDVHGGIAGYAKLAAAERELHQPPGPTPCWWMPVTIFRATQPSAPPKARRPSN